MNDDYEKLSALLDDQADLHADGTLDELVRDVNLQNRARRYQIIGDTLRRDLPESLDLDFHHRVMQEINKEARPAVSTEQVASGGFMQWLRGFALKPVAGMAVAAAVAVVTVSVWNPQQGQPGGAEQSVASAETQKIEQYGQQQLTPVLPASTATPASGMQWQVDRGSIELQNKLNGYLVNHNEYSNSVQGFIPQARVAGFDAE